MNIVSGASALLFLLVIFGGGTALGFTIGFMTGSIYGYRKAKKRWFKKAKKLGSGEILINGI